MGSTARRHSRSRAWLRVLVVLLALLVPGAPAEVSAKPVAAAAEFAEYDVVEPVLRPAPCAHRPAAPLRPAPLPTPAPGVPAAPPLRTPPSPSYALHILRTVVLRC
ncbi:hypothetical protein SAMN04487983_104828 [Streptomyces sp. yr375]|uniref:hypothetical protein n=1 Tax=Streptomyces sp. yr375 TaxID=1761906 RepID=UPI0008B10F79|nr:hypothetical protein [Streptomyces sp. yr375]SES39222.1 hypothetical protein SAMN04487983_104828 [Streptomyces sp. yr375]